MKLTCDCGNEMILTLGETDKELIKRGCNPDFLGREGYVNLKKDYKKFELDSQYEWFYIECNSCNEKFKIGT